MKTSTKNIVIGILIIIVLVLLARFVVFKSQFENFGKGLERIGTWQDDYKKDHPNASKQEMDAAFETNMASLKLWQTKYKDEHPDATKAEMDAAFNAAFSTKN